MPELDLYQVDAFAARAFEGNPAAVCPLETWLPDATMQAIALENHLSETAFCVPTGEPSRWGLRWFTPTCEVPLCGHATLATAHVLLNVLGAADRIARFDTLSGPLAVERGEDGRLVMDLPADPLSAPWAADHPGLRALEDALGAPVLEVREGKIKTLARLQDAATVRDLAPDLGKIAAIDTQGVIVTAEAEPDDWADIVSRFFAPAAGVPEDPVTGSAHCVLVPYWAERMGASTLRAYQASQRGGRLWCTLRGDRVILEGEAVLVVRGTLMW